MPLSITDTTAEEALDTFRYKIESVVSGLAKDLGTPYPSTVVAHEAEARRVVPGSLFKLCLAAGLLLHARSAQLLSPGENSQLPPRQWR